MGLIPVVASSCWASGKLSPLKMNAEDSMSSKDSVLNHLKRQIVPRTPLPEVLEGDWIRFDDPVAKFIEMVQFAGASCRELSSLCNSLRTMGIHHYDE